MAILFVLIYCTLVLWIPILQLCWFTAPHRRKVDLSQEMIVRETFVIASVVQHLHSKFLMKPIIRL
jgi:hypothetical protein